MQRNLKTNLFSGVLDFDAVWNIKKKVRGVYRVMIKLSTCICFLKLALSLKGFWALMRWLGVLRQDFTKAQNPDPILQKKKDNP